MISPRAQALYDLAARIYLALVAPPLFKEADRLNAQDTVTSAEQLSALPDGTIMLSRDRKVVITDKQQRATRTDQGPDDLRDFGSTVDDFAPLTVIYRPGDD